MFITVGLILLGVLAGLYLVKCIVHDAAIILKADPKEVERLIKSGGSKPEPIESKPSAKHGS